MNINELYNFYEEKSFENKERITLSEQELLELNELSELEKNSVLKAKIEHEIRAGTDSLDTLKCLQKVLDNSLSEYSNYLISDLVKKEDYNKFVRMINSEVKFSNYSELEPFIKRLGEENNKDLICKFIQNGGDKKLLIKYVNDNQTKKMIFSMK